MKPLYVLLLGMIFAANVPAEDTSRMPQGLVLDLNADRGVTIEDGKRVTIWRNQVSDFAAQDFVCRDQGRKERGSGRPTLRTSIKELRDHNALSFRQQELVCLDEDAFDALTQGDGCTWFAVLAPDEQRVGLKDVNSFFGNLRNGGNYEGLWCCLSDDNQAWWGVRNGVTFGRFDANNPQIHGETLRVGQFTILAGRLAAGIGEVNCEIFHNDTRAAAQSKVPINVRANPSKMAIGQERDAVEHPGVESFDGELARLLIFARPLDNRELTLQFAALREEYGIAAMQQREQADEVPAKKVPAVEVYSKWPFDADEAKRRQQETAKTTGYPATWETRIGDKGPTLIWRLIPAGKFMMGSPDDEPGHEGDERLHAETISEPFYMLQTQLTAEQHAALLGLSELMANERKLPATMTYRDTVDIVLPALAKHAPDGWKVILPDQVRLEYASRAGIALMNPGGDNPEDALPYAWTRENSDKKMQHVAQKRPNAWGLFDVIGNRWHWFWRDGKGYGDASMEDHIVYGGTYHAESGGNGARLANIMISNKQEGARFALLRAETPLPKGHPQTLQHRP